MKGINIQFDNLVTLLQKNINNKQLLKSKQNFQLVYQKITQESFKTVNLIFQNLLDDFSIKQSFNKLIKQLKTFLALKPTTQQDDQDDYFNREFDEVKQFMNNRKPVMSDIDSTQRGDIYKFLHQAQTKQRDIEQFMGNMNKFNNKGSKKLLLTNNKWKQTLKHINVITEDIDTQTDLTMKFFQKIQIKLPSLFMKQSLQSLKTNNSQTNNFQTNNFQTNNINNISNKQNTNNIDPFDIDARIDQIVKDKLQQKAKLDQQIKLKQKEKQIQDKTKLQNIKNQKKKSNQNNQNNKRNSNSSNVSMKRSSNTNSNNNNSKTKSNFVNNKNQNLNYTQKDKIQNKQSNLNEQNKINIYQNNNTMISINGINQNLTESQVDEQLSKVKKLIPSFQNMSQSLSQLKILQGINPQQLKNIYQVIKNSVTESLIKNSTPQNLKILNQQNFNCRNSSNNNKQNTLINPTVEKQMNTDITYFTNKAMNNADMTNLLYVQNQNNLTRSNSNISAVRNKNHVYSSSMSIQNSEQYEKFQKNNIQGNYKYIDSQKNKKGVKFQSELNNNQRKISGQNRQKNNSISTKERLQGVNDGNLSKSVLPQISKNESMDLLNKAHKSDSTKLLAKQGKSAQQYLKKLKDTKYLKEFQKPSNKQNYSLDMYKAKKDLISKNRVSQHVNLPSLNRNTPNRGVASLHQDLNETGKIQYLKKSSKKHILNQSMQNFSALNNDKQSLGESPTKKGKKDKKKDVFKQEQRIMKQLQRISKDNAAKSNMKSIAMYVQFVESVHLRRCGEKCIHLQRFYQFLHKNNLQNRKQLLLHKTDMNMNCQL